MSRYNRLAPYMEHHFLATKAGSSWEAFLHGFKISGPLVFDGKKDLAQSFPFLFIFQPHILKMGEENDDL